MPKRTPCLDENTIKQIIRDRHNPESKQYGRFVFAIGGVPSLFLDCSEVDLTDKTLRKKRQYFLRLPMSSGFKNVYYPQSFTTAEVRKQASIDRGNALKGIDPNQKKREIKEAKRREREAKKQAQEDQKNTLRNIAQLWFDLQIQNGRYKKYMDSKKAEREEYSLLNRKILETLGDKPINQITSSDLAETFNPIFQTSRTTTGRLLSLVKGIFAYAKIQHLIKENPINDDFSELTKLAKKNRPKGSKHPALPFNQIPQFIEALLKEGGINAYCIIWGFLTATRSQLARTAQWSQIDPVNRKWEFTEDQDKIKEGDDSDRVIFLSTYALDFLSRLPKLSPYIFSSTGKLILSTSLDQLIKKLHEQKKEIDGVGWIDPNTKDKEGNPKKITFHGSARSGFRSWAQDDENGNIDRFSPLVAELCLQHKQIIGDQYKGAYNRSPLEKSRLEIMEAWGKFILGDSRILDKYLPKEK